MLLYSDIAYWANQIMMELMDSSSCNTATLSEIIADQLYFCAFHQNLAPNASNFCYFVEEDVHYDSFYSDFGPLNLAVLYRFCQKINKVLKVSEVVFFIVVVKPSVIIFFFL